MVYHRLAALAAGGVGGDGAEQADGVTVDPAAVAAATDGAVEGSLGRDLAAELAAVPAGEDAERRERVASLAEDLAATGEDPSALVAACEPLVEALVDEAFPGEEGAELKRALRVALGDLARGVDAMAEAETSAADEGGGVDAVDAAVDLHDVVEMLPHSTFLVDDEHTVLAYNDAICDQLSIGPTEAIGEDCRETIAAATYSDGRRHHTLADRVVQHPRTAHEEHDVERIDDDYAFGDRVVYEDRSVMQDEAGIETHIVFEAMPFFDDDGDLVAVLELVEDRSLEAKREAAMTALVEDVCTTLEALADGDFAARAEFEDEHDVVDDELLRIVRQVNDMIGDFEALIEQVSEQTTTLADSVAAAADAADGIDRQASEQNEALQQVAREMEDFSATMEEVAASADQVSDAADAALAEATDGREAAAEAQHAADEVRTTSRDLVDTVDELEAYMDEIEAMADVIADVAEQTNLLALNANIEAARAGEAGEGFAVVADEVKELANETQRHTEDIADRVAAVQDQTTETVETVERSHERIQTADDRIETAVDSLDAIVDTVEDAAAGINEVADANEDQAATVEEVLATVEEARETAETVEATADDIVTETDEQREAVGTLSAHVDGLLDDGEE